MHHAAQPIQARTTTVLRIILAACLEAHCQAQISHSQAPSGADQMCGHAAWSAGRALMRLLRLEMIAQRCQQSALQC